MTVLKEVTQPGAVAETAPDRNARPPSRAPASRYFAALDGLRGIAVLLVIARHASAMRDPEGGISLVVHHAMRMGWVGVDIFFVLSGFLITGILIDTRGRPGSLKSFYVRRVLRIFPLYFAVLAIVFFVLPWTPVGGTPAMERLQSNAAWFWGYAVNILISLRGEASTPLALGHLWSLSVEEQFYLVWPFVVVLVSPRRLGRACLLLMAGAVLLRLGLILATGWGTDAGYMLMPARMDALLIGGLLALLMRNDTGRLAVVRWHRPVGLLSAVSLAALIAWRGGLERSDPYVQVFGYVALSVLSFAAIAAVVSNQAPSRFSRVLKSPLLRAMGKYSYAIYVFHHPIIGFIRRTMPPLQYRWTRGSVLVSELFLFTVAAVLSFGLAWVSWKVIEEPFLSLKRYFPRTGSAA